MRIPLKLRSLLGRTRIAAGYALGWQAMIREVTPYDDDVWIVSYPKSGNTWTRFLIANLIADGKVIDWANIESLVPDTMLHRDSQLRRIPRPRYLKSHSPYHPQYRRVIFIVRDPRDVAVSYYHFAKKSHWISGEKTIADFSEAFMTGKMDPYGNWGENVGSWLGARRGSKGFLVVRYEDLLIDAEQQLARIAEDLQIPVNTARLQSAIDNSRADRLRKLEKMQHDQHTFLKRTEKDLPFVRSATANQWQTELPLEVSQAIEKSWGRVMVELGYLPIDAQVSAEIATSRS